MGYGMHVLFESGTPCVHRKNVEADSVVTSINHELTLQIVRASSGPVTCISKQKYRDSRVISGGDVQFYRDDGSLDRGVQCIDELT